jgi:hypothetical protein
MGKNVKYMLGIYIAHFIAKVIEEAKCEILKVD